MEPLKFIHTGDLHLDTPFKGLTQKAPDQVSRLLREATIRAWERIVDLAIEERADFVVVAGDVFESADRSLLGQIKFRDGLARLSQAGIAGLVVTGNHDPLSGWEPAVTWPPLAYRFPADDVESRSVIRGGLEVARVYGISYPVRDVTENLALRFKRNDQAPFAIGVLHANVGGIPGHAMYSPCSLDDLIAARMDYWALGHIHDWQVLRGQNPAVVYCGNPQGRDLGEQNPRGCVVVNVDAGGRVQTEFRPVDVARWQVVSVPIDEIARDDELVRSSARAVSDAQSRAGVSIIARLHLIGRGTLHSSLARAGFTNDLTRLIREELSSSEPFAWLDSVRDETRSDVDLALRRQADDVLGEFLKLVSKARQASSDSPEITDRAVADLVEESVDEVYGQPRVTRFLRESRPVSGRLTELLNEAEWLVADRLAGD